MGAPQKQGMFLLRAKPTSVREKAAFGCSQQLCKAGQALWAHQTHQGPAWLQVSLAMHHH